MMRVSLTALFVSVALSACGGGGSDAPSTAPAAAAPSSSTPSSAEGVTPAPTGITVVRRNVVQFDEEMVFDNRNVWPLPAAVQPGNTLVLAFIPTLGESTILSVVDDVGNSYHHDYSSQQVHFFHLSNITNGPVRITALADMPLDARLYAWEISGLGTAPVITTTLNSFTCDESASASLTTSGAAFLAALVQTKPSRQPVADGGATLHRLLQLSGGEPYTDKVSEHAVYRVDTAGGAHVIGSSWVGPSGQNTGCEDINFGTGPTTGHIGAISFQPGS